MANEEDLQRQAHQAQALDIHRSSGAMIVHSHLNRQQEVIGVTRDDLEDILGFDGLAAGFGALGMFLLSGACWTLAENALDADGFAMDALSSFCIASIIFGAACLLAGILLHRRKRGRIRRIFDQTKIVGD